MLKLWDTFVAILWIGLFAAGCIGYVLNLSAIWGLPMGGQLLLRIIGIFLFPVGMVLGWL